MRRPVVDSMEAPELLVNDDVETSVNVPVPTVPGTYYGCVSADYQQESGQVNTANDDRLTAPFEVTAVPQFALGGVVNGMAAGHSLVLREALSGTPLTRDQNGGFVFPAGLPDGTAYRIEMQTQPQGQTCTVSNGEGQINGVDVGNIVVNCGGAPMYTVGGNVTGLPAGNSVSLVLNTGNPPVVAGTQSFSSGPYAFGNQLPVGTIYLVSLASSPAGYTCTIPAGAETGTIGSANVTTVVVNCTVVPLSTSTTLTDAPDPSTAGIKYLVRVNVTSASGVPTGEVAISDGTNSCSAVLDNGMGACELVGGAPGIVTLTANYAPNGTFLGSTQTESHRTLAIVLNDTGWMTCSGISSCPAPLAPDQDGDHGRDAQARSGTLAKVGGGAAGFDYTKISNTGAALPATAAFGTGPNDWACTRDNLTGLVWEVKVDDPASPHHYTHLFTWYDPNPATNGGHPGAQSGAEHPMCNATIPHCTTLDFIAAANQQSYCGASNWRLPTVQELNGLVYRGRTAPTIEVNYFPNNPPGQFPYWTSTTDASSSVMSPPFTRAWAVWFNGGGTARPDKFDNPYVRLVRSPTL